MCKCDRLFFLYPISVCPHTLYESYCKLIDAPRSSPSPVWCRLMLNHLHNELTLMESPELSSTSFINTVHQAAVFLCCPCTHCSPVWWVSEPSLWGKFSSQGSLHLLLPSNKVLLTYLRSIFNLDSCNWAQS